MARVAGWCSKGAEIVGQTPPRSCQAPAMGGTPTASSSQCRGPRSAGDWAAMTALDGINTSAVTTWFAEHVPEARAPLSFSLIAGGRSNLTFKVMDAAARGWVLRRPPLGAVLDSAHDMAREHRIMVALG